jgi:hypothetical protein
VADFGIDGAIELKVNSPHRDGRFLQIGHGADPPRYRRFGLPTSTHPRTGPTGRPNSQCAGVPHESVIGPHWSERPVDGVLGLWWRG